MFKSKNNGLGISDEMGMLKQFSLKSESRGWGDGSEGIALGTHGFGSPEPMEKLDSVVWVSVVPALLQGHGRQREESLRKVWSHPLWCTQWQWSPSSDKVDFHGGQPSGRHTLACTGRSTLTHGKMKEVRFQAVIHTAIRSRWYHPASKSVVFLAQRKMLYHGFVRTK